MCSPGSARYDNPYRMDRPDLQMIRSTRINFVIALFALVVVGSRRSSAADETASSRLQFQYLDGTTRIPAARENEHRREHVSFEKAVAYLDDGAVAWQNEHGCISCHTNGS